MGPSNDFGATVHAALAKYGNEISSGSVALLAAQVNSEEQLKNFILGFESNLREILTRLVHARILEHCRETINIAPWCVAIASVNDEHVWPVNERERAIAKMLGVSIQEIAVSILSTIYSSSTLSPETPECDRLILIGRRPRDSREISLSTLFLGHKALWFALTRHVISEKLQSEIPIQHRRKDQSDSSSFWTFGGSLADWVNFLDKLTIVASRTESAQSMPSGDQF